MKDEDKSVAIEATIDEKNSTYTDPTTGKTWPFYYELTPEQQKELTEMASAFVAKCTDYAVPVLVLLQLRNSEESSCTQHLGSLPGPRTGTKMLRVQVALMALQQLHTKVGMRLAAFLDSLYE